MKSQHEYTFGYIRTGTQFIHVVIENDFLFFFFFPFYCTQTNHYMILE